MPDEESTSASTNEVTVTYQYQDVEGHPIQPPVPTEEIKAKVFSMSMATTIWEDIPGGGAQARQPNPMVIDPVRRYLPRHVFYELAKVLGGAGNQADIINPSHPEERITLTLVGYSPRPPLKAEVGMAEYFAQAEIPVVICIGNLYLTPEPEKEEEPMFALEPPVPRGVREE